MNANFRIVLAFLLLCAAAIISNLWFTRVDHSITGIDSQNHLLHSLVFFHYLSDITVAPSFFGRIIHMLICLGTPTDPGNFYWPNGLNILAAALYAQFGVSLVAAKCALLPYLAVLLVCCYSLGNRLLSPKAGLLAAFLVFMYPMVFLSSRHYQLDFPLTAMVAAGLAALFSTDYFRRRGRALCFAAILGWGLHIKGQFLFFILPPLFVYIAQRWRFLRKHPANSSEKKTFIAHIFLCLSVAMLIAAIWWAAALPFVRSTFVEHIANPQKIQETPILWHERLSVPVLLNYALSVYQAGLGPILCLLFLWAALGCARRRFPERAPLAAAIIVPFFLFLFVFSIKHARFFMPFFPVAAVISADALCRLSRPRLRRGLICCVSAAALLQFFLLSYTSATARAGLPRPFRALLARNALGADYWVDVPFSAHQYGFDRIADLCLRHSRQQHRLIPIGVITTISYPQAREIIYRLSVEHPRLALFGLYASVIRDFARHINDFEFILLITAPGEDTSWPREPTLTDQLQRYQPWEIMTMRANTRQQWDEIMHALLRRQLQYRHVTTMRSPPDSPRLLTLTLFQRHEPGQRP